MRIYLDSCSLQRPLDDQTQPRIRVETEAVLVILAAAQSGDIIMVNSGVLEYEMRRIPDNQRRSEMAAVLALAKERLVVTDEAESLAKSLENRAIRPMGAVHLALASTAKVGISLRHAMIAFCAKPERRRDSTARLFPCSLLYRRLYCDNTRSTHF